MRKRRCAIVPALLASAAFMAGCGQSGGDGGGKVGVVASTTHVGDFARNVGGDAVEEHQILQPNSDPHDHEPRPEDVRETATADLVFMSGDGLDPWVRDVASESGGEASVVDLSRGLSDKLESDEEHGDHEGGELEGEEAGHAHEGGYDPHWWQDPTNAEAAVKEIRDSLAEADPENRQTYRENAEAYLGKLRRLDREMEGCISGLPEDRRKLVTDHEAFGYLTRRYDIEFVGAVIPSQSTQGQASAGDTRDLISLVEKENVRAVFPESSVSADLARTIADETGASAEYTLYGDTLGPEGSDGDTYLKMMAANADSLVRGFTGGEKGCNISVAG